ncbi:MAG: LysM peptidoglycan-binding domain-containing protein [Actinobacteria bacterium]|nr:LysM peptidoglycan-binding domain-containing protein [Actinomycetota bacterium]
MRRTLALVLAVAFILTSVSPAWALEIGAEAEGEGSAAPGTLPGLEAGPELEGGETVLGEEAPLAGEEVEEEVVVPVEPESPEAAPASPAPVEEPQPEVVVIPEAVPPPAPAPSATPTYEAEPPPTYETEAATPAVVHGEAIVAPAEPQRPAHAGSPPPVQGVPEVAPVVEAPPPATSPVEAPEPAPSPPAVQQPAVVEAPGALQGHRSHTVRPGESLWSIATALLPPGAGNADIAREVRRLWRLNADRIGTGDPNLILVGTELRLH